MNYDIIKYERGQVWMIRHKTKPQTNGHEQDKDRPWLILSIGKFNKSSGMVTAVPITTRDKVTTPAQVLYRNDRNQNNVILCEQVKSFDYSSGAYIFEYIGTLSPEILEEVDVAISIHLGLHYSPITLKGLYDSMEAIIKSVGFMEAKNNTPKFTDDDVLAFASKLQELAGHQEMAATVVDSNEDSSTDESETIISADETGETIIEPATPPAPNPPEEEDTKTRKRAPRINWTRENCEKFLEDAEKLPMKKVMERWNMSQKSRFYSTKNYVAKLLTEMTE